MVQRPDCNHLLLGKKYVFPNWLAKTSLWSLWSLADCSGQNLDECDRLVYKQWSVTVRATVKLKKVMRTGTGYYLPSWNRTFTLEANILPFWFASNFFKFYYPSSLAASKYLQTNMKNFSQLWNLVATKFNIRRFLVVDLFFLQQITPSVRHKHWGTTTN